MNEQQNVVGGRSSASPLLPNSEAPASSNIAVKKALDAFTILKTITGLASKRIIAGPDGTPIVIGFNGGKLNYVFEQPVSSIIELSVMLTTIEEFPNCSVIRGAPRADLDCNRAQQRLKINFQTPPLGRKWICIDFDKIQLPPGLSLQQDIGAVCEHLIGLLPPEFHQASHHWQLTSSAGITDPSKASLHLWFWLDRPVPDAVLKGWAVHWNTQVGIKLIDPALFNDVQPHYTAAPTFEGLSDPFPARSGLTRKMVDEVALRLPRLQKTPPPRVVAKLLQPGGGFETILEQIGDHEGGLGFHDPIIRAVASYAGTHGRDGTDIEALYEVVRAKVLAADRSNHHHDDYIEHMASRSHIVPAIEQALKKYGGPSPRRKSRQVPGVPPHFPSKPLAASEASARLQHLVAAFFGEFQ